MHEALSLASLSSYQLLFSSPSERYGAVLYVIFAPEVDGLLFLAVCCAIYAKVCCPLVVP